MILSSIIRLRDSKVLKQLTDFGRQPLRKIAKETGLSKDSVARSIDSITARNRYPESALWETEEGQEWLRRLFFAALVEFGVKGGQGKERISAFFKRIRIEDHVGASPTALRTQILQVEEELANFQRMKERQQVQEGSNKREVVAAGDETFFNEKPTLVLMDLASGYLIVEDETDDRSYDTWKEKAQSRLDQLGLHVRHFISDRGKSLIKLATVGLKCCAGADLFHAQYDISKWLGCALHGKLARVRKQLKKAETSLQTLKEKGSVSKEITKQKQIIRECKDKFNSVEKSNDAYHEAQQSVSAAVHAFSIDDNQSQTSKQAEKRLEDQVQHFEEIAEKQSVKDKKGVAGKFRRQIKDVACTIDTWWLWTRESLFEFQLSEEVRHWLLAVLLPVLYWHRQIQKTQHPEMRKAYEAALKKAQAAYGYHPLTRTLSETDIERWRCWGEWACGNFHRASSAVEGRNGCLSQNHFNGRGLSDSRRRALTATHNYDTKRRDGTTPAQRLYGKPFEDMFEWLLGQMGDLPVPRKARRRVEKNPLEFNIVAA